MIRALNGNLCLRCEWTYWFGLYAKPPLRPPPTSSFTSSPLMPRFFLSSPGRPSNQMKFSQGNPGRVLEQVMSVFTFWGRGLVRRDDAYSAALIDATLKGLVPDLIRLVTVEEMIQEETGVPLLSG